MRRLLCALFLLVAPLPALSQDAATLVADRVEIQGDNVLVAEGSVEVLQRGMRLRATRVTYDQAADRLRIDGPIVLTDESGTRVLADQADLSADMQDGIMTSARLVMGQQLQMAATELQRIGGRYTELSNTVASSCRVCNSSATPLWEIRAKRVIHDQLEKQIYFQNAQLRFAGVPVFYFPRLRMPDPSLKRATGFLRPEIRSTSELGTGFVLPYFIALNDSRDVTLLPYLSSNGGRSLGLRYREAFRTGNIEFEGAVSQDEILQYGTRGYVFGSGGFALPRNFGLTFGLQMVSDNAYLRDYGISDQDRLDSFLAAERVRRDQYVLGRIHKIGTLRDEGDDTIVPATILDLIWIDRHETPLIGGQGALRYQIAGSNISSAYTNDVDGDGQPDARDTTRALIRYDWRRDWVLSNGMVASALGRAQGDVTWVGNDPTYASQIERLTGSFGGELRWPLLRTETSGATQLLEPVAQILFSPTSNADVPNEDSLLAEFDEGNLFSIDRFPGTDAVEQGNRAALGLAWTRYGTKGSTLGLAAGRVFRAEDMDQFNIGSGLDGASSNWLLGMTLATPVGLSLTQRMLLDDDLDLQSAEARMGLFRQRYALTTGYYWSEADPDDEFPNDISELTINGAWQVTDNWTSSFGVRHDFIAGRSSRASFDLQYRNECIQVDLSLSRWFADSTSVTPTTEFGLSVDLLGFGGGPDPGPTRQCRG
ncbi:MAG: LPS-assembly protein LptD [Cereibacter sphaeroides]|uniref:LPS-assembly protein LptD n=1 Tax=Cereibacter sphaeroides TaxID=1063 RepID=A0A2W5S9A1_CERSP|nr:MAG: LPS-assembly protein LptD [Cereibacter sphaeroides]